MKKSVSLLILKPYFGIRLLRKLIRMTIIPILISKKMMVISISSVVYHHITQDLLVLSLVDSEGNILTLLEIPWKLNMVSVFSLEPKQV